MLRNLSNYYLLICCKQGSSTHFCHFLATAFVTDVLVGSNPSVMGPKKKGLHSWRPIKSVVGDEGCPRAAGAARAPLRRSAPRVLRWKTLRVSSAPHPGGFESHALGPKMKGPHSWEPIKSVVGDEGCRVRLAPPAPRFVATLLACSAGKRFAFPQLRTLAGSNPMHWAQKRKAPIAGSLISLVVGDEGFEPPALCV